MFFILLLLGKEKQELPEDVDESFFDDNEDNDDENIVLEELTENKAGIGYLLQKLKNYLTPPDPMHEPLPVLPISKIKGRLLTPKEGCGFSKVANTRIVGGQPAKKGKSIEL